MKEVSKKTEEMEVLTGVVDGIGFSSDERNKYKNLCDGIHKDVKKVEASYLSIARALYTIYNEKLYQIENYPNIYEFAEDKFSLKRTNCSNYIRLCVTYGKLDETTKECTGLLPEYKDFSLSQLVTMFNIPEELRKQVTPDMSVREIKRIHQIYKERKGIASKSDESDNALSDKTSNKSAKKQKLELIKTADLSDIMETQKETLLEKLDTFLKEHPDARYDIAVTLTYEE